MLRKCHFVTLPSLFQPFLSSSVAFFLFHLFFWALSCGCQTSWCCWESCQIWDPSQIHSGQSCGTKGHIQPSLVRKRIRKYKTQQLKRVLLKLSPTLGVWGLALVSKSLRLAQRPEFWSRGFWYCLKTPGLKGRRWRRHKALVWHWGISLEHPRRIPSQELQGWKSSLLPLSASSCSCLKALNS